MENKLKYLEEAYGEESTHRAFEESIAFKDHAHGFKVAEVLLKEDYVVMLSYEEGLLIVSYQWSPGSDRNDVECFSFL